MDKPHESEVSLASLLRYMRGEVSYSQLHADDKTHLNKLVALIDQGCPAIVLVQDNTRNKLHYMFSNASHAEAVSLLGRILELTGRRLSGEL